MGGGDGNTWVAGEMGGCGSNLSAAVYGGALAAADSEVWTVTYQAVQAAVECN